MVHSKYTKALGNVYNINQWSCRYWGSGDRSGPGTRLKWDYCVPSEIPTSPYQSLTTGRPPYNKGNLPTEEDSNKVKGHSFQRILTLFIRGSVTIWPISRLASLDTAKKVNLLLIQHKRSNLIQTSKTGRQPQRDTLTLEISDYYLMVISFRPTLRSSSLCQMVYLGRKLAPFWLPDLNKNDMK